MQSIERASWNPISALLLIAPFFLWGTAMVAMKGVIPHTSPLFMAGVRVIPAGVLILVAAIFMGRPQPRGWKAWLWICGFALIDVSLFQGFLAEGLERTGAGLGSIMIDSQPLAVALLSLWLFGDRIGIWGWLGLVLGVGGISLIGIPEELFYSIFTGEATSTSLGWQSIFAGGEWLMLLAALSMAIGTVSIRFVSRHADVVTATGWHMIIGGLPLWGLSGWKESQQWQNLAGNDWIALAYATIFGSAIAYGLFFYFASRGNLTSLSSLTFLTPVFALLFGNLLLQETLTSLQWTGVSFTLVSIFLINRRDMLSGKKSPETLKEITSTSSQPVSAVTIPVRESEVDMVP